MKSSAALHHSEILAARFLSGPRFFRNLLCVDPSADIFNAHERIGDASCHSRRHVQLRMCADEIVEQRVERDHMGMVRNFLAVAIGERCEAPHVHTFAQHVEDLDAGLKDKLSHPHSYMNPYT